MKRVTPKTLQERQNNKAKYADLPKLKDILVDLSVQTESKVVRKLRFVGPPVEISEIQDKIATYIIDPKTNKKVRETKRVPFPDAHKNGSPTRIGHDDPKECPWRKMGYISTRRFVQRCLEEQADGTWTHKILVKGPAIFDSIFNWEQARREENEDGTLSTFLGGDKAPIVRITAVYDTGKLGNVDYTTAIGSKDMELTEEHINMLRAVREPSADELNAFRNEYNEMREEDPDMPEWRDYFEYGHDIRRIFKFTPPVEDTPTPVLASEEEEEEFDTPDSESTKEETAAVDIEDIEDLAW